MRIQGQNIKETKDALEFILVEPYWSAWKKFGWKNREFGIGISIDLVKEAHHVKKHIVALYDGARYDISPVTINNFYKQSPIKPVYTARGGIALVVVPHVKFTITRPEAEPTVTKDYQQSLL